MNRREKTTWYFFRLLFPRFEKEIKLLNRERRNLLGMVKVWKGELERHRVALMEVETEL